MPRRPGCYRSTACRIHSKLRAHIAQRNRFTPSRRFRAYQSFKRASRNSISGLRMKSEVAAASRSVSVASNDTTSQSRSKATPSFLDRPPTAGPAGARHVTLSELRFRLSNLAPSSLASEVSINDNKACSISLYVAKHTGGTCVVNESLCGAVFLLSRL